MPGGTFMNHAILSGAIEIAAALILIPWLIFVTTSIFSFRTEIALLKQQINQNEEMQKQNEEMQKMLREIIEKLDG
jgi:cell division protein FtsL